MILLSVMILVGVLSKAELGRKAKASTCTDRNDNRPKREARTRREPLMDLWEEERRRVDLPKCRDVRGRINFR